jgi:hypothetical protein
MIKFVKHFLNPLHIYCRLIDCGFSKSNARKICGRYDKVFFLIVKKEVDNDKRRSLRSVCEGKTI